MIPLPYNMKVILLAAGKSQRFNDIKLLAPIKKREYSIPLIQHVLQQISKSLAILNLNPQNLFTATGCYHEDISTIIDKQFSVIYCSNAHLGLGHTIAQSVARIISDVENTTEQASHIMITLADQVALTSDDYRKLIEQSISMPDQLICAIADQEIMPPAIFPRRYFDQLVKLTGDKGAKALLHQNKEHLQTVQLPNAAIDIDTKQDLHNWHKNDK